MSTYVDFRGTPAPVTPPTGIAMGTLYANSITSGILPPEHAVDDIILCFVETANGVGGIDPPSTHPPDGYEFIPGAEYGVGNTRLSVFWRRATAASDGSALYGGFIGQQMVCGMIIRGCPNVGSPFDSVTGGVVPVATTAVSVPGVTTTTNGCLIVQAATNELYALADDLWSGMANPNLSSFTTWMNATRTSGVGGGVLVTSGVLAAAGPSGPMTATLASASRQALVTIALKGTF